MGRGGGEGRGGGMEGLKELLEGRNERRDGEESIKENTPLKFIED